MRRLVIACLAAALLVSPAAAANPAAVVTTPMNFATQAMRHGRKPTPAKPKKPRPTKPGRPHKPAKPAPRPTTPDEPPAPPAGPRPKFVRVEVEPLPDGWKSETAVSLPGRTGGILLFSARLQSRVLITPLHRSLGTPTEVAATLRAMMLEAGCQATPTRVVDRGGTLEFVWFHEPTQSFGLARVREAPEYPSAVLVFQGQWPEASAGEAARDFRQIERQVTLIPVF